MFISDLIGKPWAWPPEPPHSYDCWALAVEVRNRLGLDTPDYNKPQTDHHGAHRACLSKPDLTVWQKLDTPREGCLVGFGRAYVVHCGVYTKGRVVHSATPSRMNNGAVLSQSLETVQRWFGRATFWEAVSNVDD